MFAGVHLKLLSLIFISVIYVYYLQKKISNRLRYTYYIYLTFGTMYTAFKLRLKFTFRSSLQMHRNHKMFSIPFNHYYLSLQPHKLFNSFNLNIKTSSTVFTYSQVLAGLYKYIKLKQCRYSTLFRVFLIVSLSEKNTKQMLYTTLCIMMHFF